jgi:MinD-like ATPase involved in chromosome partitioning or flagellar assembly
MDATGPSRLVVVAGPPGGVGKSTVALNLAASLTRRGAEVTLVDLDQGGGDLTGPLGVRDPDLGVFHFLFEKIGLHEVVKDTEVPGLRFAGGAGDVLGGMDLSDSQIRRLIDHLKGLRGQVTVVDLGSGGAYHNLILLALADVALVVTTPDKAALAGTYSLLKMGLYRALIVALRRAGFEQAASLAARARLPENDPGLATVDQLIEALAAEAEPGSAEAAREVTASFRPRLVVNLLDDLAEAKAYRLVADLARRQLGIEVSLLGLIPRDPLVGRAAERNRPYVLDRPGVPLSLCLLDMARQLWEDKIEGAEPETEPARETMEIISVNISEAKGTRKTPVPDIDLEVGVGVQGDAHRGAWHRQVSLLAQESIAKMIAQGLTVGPGDFAENLTTRGLILHTLPLGTRLAVGDKVVLEVTQIGKKCHQGCAIKELTGECIMPVEGIFAKVLTGGQVRPGDRLQVVSDENTG